MRIPETGNTISILNLADDIDTGFDELGKLPARLDRYAVAKQRALINLAQVDKRLNILSPDVPLHRQLTTVRLRMSVCGNYLSFRNYYSINTVRLHAARFCMTHLLCPFCAIRRGSKMVQAYVDRLNVVMAENAGLSMSMLTLTVKNGYNLEERYNHLKKSIQKFQLRSRLFKVKGTGYTEWSKILGFVGSYEVTNKGNGWHPHAHLMILHRTRLDVAVLKAEWFDITGDSKVLRIDPARHPNDPGQDFLEVCKYALKFSDLSPEQNLDAYEVLRGRRLVVCAGLFWGVEIPENLEDELPPDWENLPYFEMIYKFIAGSGYNLSKFIDSNDVEKCVIPSDFRTTPNVKRMVNLANKKTKSEPKGGFDECGI